MNKSLALARFDEINTAGLRITDVDRVFSNQVGAAVAQLGAYRAIRSPGTSGISGIALVDHGEESAVVGLLLGRLLPRGIWARERVALFTRHSAWPAGLFIPPWISISVMDASTPTFLHADALDRLRPTMIIAPAQTLRTLAVAQANGALAITPTTIVSTAEVLDKRDRALVSATFGRPKEVYHAHEALIATTCQRGVLHLEEDYVLIEKDDLGGGRFVPVITNLKRIGHPVIRYRLDDVLRERGEPCMCGHPGTPLESVEGRVAEQWVLPGLSGQTVRVYGDMLRETIGQALPLNMGYQLLQHAPTDVALRAPLPMAGLGRIRERLTHRLEAHGVNIDALHWQLHSEEPQRIAGARFSTISRPATYEL